MFLIWSNPFLSCRLTARTPVTHSLPVPSFPKFFFQNFGKTVFFGCPFPVLNFSNLSIPKKFHFLGMDKQSFWDKNEIFWYHAQL